MEINSSLLIIVAALLGFLLLFGIVRSVFGQSTLGSILAPIVLIVVLAVGAEVYFDQHAVTVPTKVDSRSERVFYHYGFGGHWSRTTTLNVLLPSAGAGAPTEVGVGVDPATFDQHAPGSTFSVRYLPEIPLIVRPATSDGLLLFQPLLSRSIVIVVIGILVSAGVLLLANRLSRAGRAFGAIALTLVWMVAAGLGVVALPLAFAPARPRTRQASARVREVIHVTKASFGRGGNGVGSDVNLIQPFDTARLAFTPDGFDHPVEAFDTVDAGSVPGLVKGQTVPIVYAATAPRDARINGGERRNVWLNTLVEVETIGVLMLVINLVGLARRK